MEVGGTEIQNIRAHILDSVSGFCSRDRLVLVDDPQSVFGSLLSVLITVDGFLMGSTWEMSDIWGRLLGPLETTVCFLFFVLSSVAHSGFQLFL